MNLNVALLIINSGMVVYFANLLRPEVIKARGWNGFFLGVTLCNVLSIAEKLL